MLNLDTDGQLVGTLEAELVVCYTLPTVEAENIAQDWVNKQGKSWPTDLTGSALTTDIRTVYLPIAVIDLASASAHYSAGVAFTHEQYVRCGLCRARGEIRDVKCTLCNGTGERLKKSTRKWNESGVVESTIRDRGGDVCELGGSKIRCGTRAIETDDWSPDLLIGHPDSREYMVKSSVTSCEGMAGYIDKHMKQELRDAAEVEAQAAVSRTALTGTGKVESVNLTEVNYRNAEGGLYLYPILVASYSYDAGKGREEVRQVQIDGHTGKIWVQLPSSVRNQRILKWAAIILIAIGAVTLAVLAG